MTQLCALLLLLGSLSLAAENTPAPPAPSAPNPPSSPILPPQAPAAPLPTEPLLPAQAGVPPPAFAPPKGGVVPGAAGTPNAGVPGAFTRRFGDLQKCMDDSAGSVIAIEYMKTAKGEEAKSAALVRSQCKEHDPKPVSLKELDISPGLTFRWEGRKYREVP